MVLRRHACLRASLNTARIAPVSLSNRLAMILVVMALAGGPFLLKGATQESEAVVKTFETRYRAAKTLQATFLERYTENGAVVRTEAGTAFFRRPGKMRWEYEAPERDLFLVDGKTAWFYEPADHTVTRVPAKQSADWRTPLALLAGEMKVSRVCAHVELAERERATGEGNVVLRCQVRGASAEGPDPRNDRQDADVPASPNGGKGDTVFFEIVRGTGELARLLVRQSGGVQVEFRF